MAFGPVPRLECSNDLCADFGLLSRRPSRRLAETVRRALAASDRPGGSSGGGGRGSGGRFRRRSGHDGGRLRRLAPGRPALAAAGGRQPDRPRPDRSGDGGGGRAPGSVGQDQRARPAAGRPFRPGRPVRRPFDRRGRRGRRAGRLYVPLHPPEDGRRPFAPVDHRRRRRRQPLFRRHTPVHPPALRLRHDPGRNRRRR